MKTLGLPIHIAELDVNIAAGGQRGTGADVAGNASATQGALVEDADRRQASAYAGIFRAFLKHHDSVKLVTFWASQIGIPGAPEAARCCSTDRGNRSRPLTR
jgi:endo-1,4-beta-xylanase